MNATDTLQATEILCMNENGIGFATKKAGDEIEAENFTSVWALDGTFDAQSISVVNLSADNIKNGVLRLYDENSNDTTGKLLIFEGPAPATPDDTYDHQAVVEVSSSGIHVKIANGAVFTVDISQGLKIKNPVGGDVVSMSADGTTINMTKTKVIDYVDYGENLRGMVMDRTTADGKKHIGLGFIKI